MKCRISNWGCVYHACMSDDCQKHEVLKHQDWGDGKCETITNINADEVLEALKDKLFFEFKVKLEKASEDFFTGTTTEKSQILEQDEN